MLVKAAQQLSAITGNPQVIHKSFIDRDPCTGLRQVRAECSACFTAAFYHIRRALSIAAENNFQKFPPQPPHAIMCALHGLSLALAKSQQRCRTIAAARGGRCRTTAAARGSRRCRATTAARGGGRCGETETAHKHRRARASCKLLLKSDRICAIIFDIMR